MSIRTSALRTVWLPSARRTFLATVIFVLSDAVCGFPLTLSKHEPESGCYIGAFVDRDSIVHGDYEKFSQLTHKKHASYITYVGYGRPFPKDWVTRVKAAGAAPHIAFEPNDGLKAVKDDGYLRQWARDAYAAQCPIFLRFASEMNGDWCAYSGNPKLYIKKFRLVHDVMKEEAPNVAMVWTPFAIPQRTIALYFPGDAWVDWVGVNIYSVYVHDGDVSQVAYREDPIEFLDFVYRLYADRKPIQISEFAATSYCRASAKDTVDFAIEKMNRLYKAVLQKYPRVKCIDWFSYNTVEAGLANNNYSVTEREPILLAYQTLISDAHFLSTVPFEPEKFKLPARPTPVKPTPAKPVSQPTLAEQDRDFERIMSAKGAVVTSISKVTVRGIANHATVSRPIEVVALVPHFIRARFVVFELDGKMIGITNNAPFVHVLRRDQYKDGPHSLRVIVEDRDGERHITDPVNFSFGAGED